MLLLTLQTRQNTQLNLLVWILIRPIDKIQKLLLHMSRLSMVRKNREKGLFICLLDKQVERCGLRLLRKLKNKIKSRNSENRCKQLKRSKRHKLTQKYKSFWKYLRKSNTQKKLTQRISCTWLSWVLQNAERQMQLNRLVVFRTEL